MADLGDQARAVAGSVSDLADLDRLFATVKADRGTVDVLFVHASTGSLASLADITPDHYDETFGTNVKGLIFTAQKALPLMGQGGSMIPTGSSASEMGMAQFSVYNATKAAVRALARGWAQDLKGTGIRYAEGG